MRKLLTTIGLVVLAVSLIGCGERTGIVTKISIPDEFSSTFLSHPPMLIVLTFRDNTPNDSDGVLVAWVQFRIQTGALAEATSAWPPEFESWSITEGQELAGNASIAANYDQVLNGASITVTGATGTTTVAGKVATWVPTGDIPLGEHTATVMGTNAGGSVSGIPVNFIAIAPDPALPATENPPAFRAELVTIEKDYSEFTRTDIPEKDPFSKGGDAFGNYLAARGLDSFQCVLNMDDEGIDPRNVEHIEIKMKVLGDYWIEIIGYDSKDAKTALKKFYIITPVNEPRNQSKPKIITHEYGTTHFTAL